MNHPTYLSEDDILLATSFFKRYEGYTLQTFLTRWDCSYAKVASILNVHPVTVRKWVSGIQRPPKATLLQLAIADHVMSNRREK